jgi:hypothetical protein
LLKLRIDGNRASLGRVTVLQARIAKMPFNRKTIRPAFDKFACRRGAGGLKAEQNAYGFENRSLALGVLAYDAGAVGRWKKIQSFKAAEMVESDFPDHANFSMRSPSRARAASSAHSGKSGERVAVK